VVLSVNLWPNVALENVAPMIQSTRMPVNTFVAKILASKLKVEVKKISFFIYFFSFYHWFFGLDFMEQD